jgi:hypothetical protein
MQCIAPKAALTYNKVVCMQHATLELQSFFAHRKRIRVPSKRRVRRSKGVHGRACTSSQKTTIHSKTAPSEQRIASKAALTYARMVRRQLATIELQHFFAHRKRIRVPSKLRVR